MPAPPTSHPRAPQDSSSALDGLLAIYGELTAALPAREPDEDLQPDAVIGSCRLVEKIAEGGMGVVWQAEQISPVKRTVALKVMKAGMDSAEFLRRFRVELEALSRLEHSNIARVYDAGMTPRGRPFLVMELVRGAAPVTEFCRREGTPLRERLELFAVICEAVQHAHSRGVIHRDLKPSNLLATREGGTLRPVVIDFGVARALDAEPGTTLVTEAGRVVGTPAYMSPEQAAAGTEAADTRADVYSLGCVLYELLTEEPPFDHERIRTSSLAELVRILREEEPPPPSERLRRAGRSAGAVRGELDCIAMKALEKDPARRYRTAAALEDDVQRHLRGEPVSARPSSLAYRLRKLVARHKPAAAAISVAALALVLIAGISLWFAQRERQERHNAEAILRFFDSDLVATARESAAASGSSDPLEAAERRVAEEFADRPVLAARLRTTLARAWLQLGQTTRAAAVLPPAATLLESELGPKHPETLRAAAGLAELYLAQGQAPAALQQWRAVRTALASTAAPELSEAEFGIAAALAADGKKAEAVRAFEPLLTHSDHTLTWRAALSLADLIAAEDAARAESLVRQVIDGRSLRLGAEHPDTLAAMASLARLRESSGDAQEAHELLRTTADGLRLSLGAAHPRTLAAQQEFATACERLGDEKTALSVTISAAHAFLSSGREREAMLRFMEAARLSRHLAMPESSDRYATEAWRLSRNLHLPAAGPWLPLSRPNFSKFTGHWYARLEVPMSWTDAEAACRGLGGHLATISSEEENNFVHGWFAQTCACWLGARRQESGAWEWVTGEPFQFTKWAGGEPSDTGGEEKFLNFGSSRLTFFRKGAEWNDHRDSGDHSGWWLTYPVCEWESPSVPPAPPSWAPLAATLPRTSVVTFGGHWYARINVDMPWHEAKAVCEALGGYPAAIGSAEENTFVCDRFATDRFVWLGATDEGHEGQWRWTNGEPWTFTAWGGDEPSNSMDEEHFLSTGHDAWNNTRAFLRQWNDMPANGEMLSRRIISPVCEWDHRPNLR